LGLRVACIYGGAGIADQIAELKRGADIVVCTPGRMIDILTMQAGKMVSLKRVSMVVMDEADRMFDMGFEPQIRMIIQNIRPDRQTVLFSATFPKQIEKLAKSVLKFPLEIVIGERSVANKDITQFVELHDEGEKFLRLLQLLGIWNDRGSVLIFVDKQDKCDQLFQDLLKAGYPCLSLHGGKDQIDRDHTLHEFKSLIKTVMVATSVAGRGLDVPEIVCVINYNCPNHIEDYVHRIGRTGRAGRKGTAYTFISPNEEQYAPLMCKALEQAEQPVPIELQAMADRFKEKVSRGEAHWVGSGFVGKGFTFDASEMNEAQKLASMQRRAYEIEQGIAQTDGKEEEEDADAFYDEKFGDVGAETEAGEAASSAPASEAGAASDSAAALEKARLLAASIASGGASLAAIPADASAETKAALARAKLIAMTMGSKGGADETPQHFSDEFDINDYPAQVRPFEYIMHHYQYLHAENP
jgi:ATP-dependent RNA helicase DDX46/PRP5